MKHTYAYNGQHLIRDDRPWLPVMGEMQFSRCCAENWRRSIKLMKAGGIDIIQSYTIWIHFEREKGVFDFTGCRDIKRFLDICAEEEMLIWLRIGPYIHGEVRHGGLPDWLFEETQKTRSNDPTYLKYVRRFWEKMYEQIKDHMDGNIIGIQYENEYVEEISDCGDAHMNVLTDMAEEIGYRSLIRSATCCRGHFLGSCLPMHGAYPDAPWDKSLEKLSPNVNYVISRIRDGGQIGNATVNFVTAKKDENNNQPLQASDMKEPWADPEGIPYMFTEMGGGVQPTYHRRPIIQPHDVSAILNAKLASGVVLPGYYMYHGGTNPGYNLHESRGAGDETGVPELNYDFQAPIRDCGMPSPVYCTLRRTNTFLHDYGEMLAPMPAVIPEDNPQNPNDLKHLRYGYRTDGKMGFLFVGNYIRGYEMAEHTRTFSVTADGREIAFPRMTIKNGDYGFYPFNIPLGKGRLLSTNAQPLCILNGDKYVFFSDEPAIYQTEGDVSGIEILTLTQEDSLRASKVTIGGKDYLILCDAPYIQEENRLLFYITKDTSVEVYPNPDDPNSFSQYTLTCPKPSVNVHVEQMNENLLMKEFSLSFDGIPADAEELLLDIDYEGNMADLFMDGRKVADQFSMGNGWKIGLARFGHFENCTLRIFALKDTDRIYMEKTPDFQNGFACALKSAKVTAIYAKSFSTLNQQ